MVVVLRYFVAVLMLAGDGTTRDCGAARSSQTVSLLASGTSVLHALATRPDTPDDLLARLKSIGVPDDLIGELKASLDARHVKQTTLNLRQQGKDARGCVPSQ